MDTTNAAPAGAAADTGTEVVSATVAAAEQGDVSTFMEADRAARQGKPVEKVTRPKAAPAKPASGPAVAGKAGEAAKGPSAADREADERLQTRVREAVDLSTSELRRQNKELLDRLNGKPAAAAGADDGTGGAPAGATPPKGSEDYKRYLAMPDAPKLADFGGDTTAHAAALSVFINDTRHAERLDADRQQATGIERAKQDIERVRTFHGRITAYKETDPEFAAKLTPEVKAIHGFARLQQINADRSARGEAALPATVDHAIGEEIYDCDAPAQVAVFLSQHPEELATLRACKTPQQLTRAFTRLETKVTGSTGAAAPAAASITDKSPTPAELRARAEAVVDRSVSHAPPPAPSLGKAGTGVDPLKKAIDTGDIGAFLELDRQSRAEKRGFGARG